MSNLEAATRAIQEAENTAADVAENMKSARYLIEHCGSLDNTIQALEWAEDNAKSLSFRISEALSATRELKRTQEPASG